MDDAGLRIFQLLVELAGIHQLSELLNNFHGLDQGIKNTLSAVGALTIIFGILQCFLGYKLFKFWCALIGFIVGAVLGLFVAATGIFSGSLAVNLIGLLVIILLAVIGAFAAFRLYLVGLFIYAFTAAFVVGFYLLALITDSTIAGLYAGIVAGLVLGIFAVIYHRFWIILTTSVSGGMTIGTSLIMVLQSSDSFWIFLLPPVFIIAGFIVQTQTVKKSPDGAPRKDVTVTVPPEYPQAPPEYPQAPPEYSQTPQEYSQGPQEYPQSPYPPYPEAQDPGYPQELPMMPQVDRDAPTEPLPQTRYED